MPVKTPAMTVPIAAPRLSGVDSIAAIGTICCATVALAPSSTEAAISKNGDGAKAAAVAAIAIARNCPTISRLRRTISPSGNRSSSPSA
ncbi:hypothetical protein D9M72_515230 [compost metagenome]